MANVLVIEDHADIRRVTVRTMRAAGYTVDEATNPDDAKKLLDSRPHDAVICDFDLKSPETGVDIAQYIKDQNKEHPPGFFLFSSTDRIDIEERSPALKGLADEGWIKGVYKKDDLTKIVQDIKSSVNVDSDAPEPHGKTPGSDAKHQWRG